MTRSKPCHSEVSGAPCRVGQVAGGLVDILSPMRVWAIICYAVATVVELVGFGLIVSEIYKSRRVLQEWRHANPNANDGGSWGQVLQINNVVIGLLGSTCRRVTAAVLVLLGILAGAAGNFLSLLGG